MQEIVHITGDGSRVSYYLVKIKCGLFKYNYLRDVWGIPLLYTLQELVKFMDKYPKAKIKNEKL